MTSQSQCRAVVSEIREKYGRLDILCSNTGIFPQCTIKSMTEQDWDTMQKVNVKGMFSGSGGTERDGRTKIRPDRDYIFNYRPRHRLSGWSHYGASKAAQLGFMRSAALEYARLGITINAVQPGNILTEGLKAQGETYLNQMRATIPTHTLGEPEDIGYAAAFLASDEAKYITGQTIIIDGGQILPESRKRCSDKAAPIKLF